MVTLNLLEGVRACTSVKAVVNVITALPLSGAFVVETELIADERGLFARTFCVNEFASHGLYPAVGAIQLLVQ